MQWLSDSYTILGADVTFVYAGRAYNQRLGRWETVSGTNMSPTDISKHRLRSVDLAIHDAVTGGLKNGVWALVFVVGDPVHTGYVVPVVQGLSSRSQVLQWAGDIAMLGGVCWRIHLGGLVAGDRVDIGVGYE